jgi:hypothetical protein
MSLRTVVSVSALLALLSVTPNHFVPAHASTKLRLTLATLHAAALTTSRAGADSLDDPYFLVSILGPRTNTETIHLPATGHLRIHRNEALGARPLAELSLEPGDTVRLLVSVLEGAKGRDADETAAAAASTIVLSQASTARAAMLSSALAPVTKDGAHWLGSATLLLTNEAGTAYWRALECVVTCKVLSGGVATPFPAQGAAPLAGVVELSGAGGTYHMQLQGQLAP